MKVIINTCFGGFELSNKAYEWLISKKGWRVVDSDNGHPNHYDAEIVRYKSHDGKTRYYFMNDNDKEIRTNKDIIECVETLGKKSWGELSQLRIVEIPDDIEWYIDEYDGIESIHEKHRSW